MRFIKFEAVHTLYCFLFLLLVISSANAQKYDFKVYSVNDGLPQGQIQDIIQTNDGFIWLATNGGGLSRFDGKRFKTYTTDEGLRNNAVSQLYEDSSGNLWVANYPGGVVTFKKDSLVNPFPNSPISNFEVWAIKEIRNNELWFGTYEGGIFILEDGELRRLTVEDGLISNSIWDFAKDEQGRIWIATQEGISVLEGDSITNYSTEDGLSGKKVYKFATDKDGNKWFPTSNGVTVWDGENFKTIKKINGVTLNYVLEIKVASDGKIWIGTQSKGVFVYDGNEYTHYTRNNGLSSNYIFTFFEDMNNNMWVGTDENGVNLYRGDAFVFYGEEFGLPTSEVLNVFIDRNGIIWLGTTEGIASFDGEKIRQIPMPGEYENKYIWEIEELPNGNLLFLMPDQTIMEYDGYKFVNYTSKKNLQKWFTYDLYVDSNDILWIATDEGLFRLDGNELSKFTKQDGMVGNAVQTVQERKDGKLLIGTYEGLSIFDGTSFKNISVDDGLANNSINNFTEDSQSNIWVGTDGGVSLLQPKENDDSYSITNFGKKEGMNLLSTHFIWFDKEGYLWQGTNGGLNRMNIPRYWEKGNMNIVPYRLSDEGMGTEFNFKAIATDSVNNAWFGSMDGLLKLDISKLKKNETNNSLKVYITDIERNSTAIEWSDYAKDLEYKTGSVVYPSVSFPSGEHSYTFSFTGLEYRNPENVEYRYKMKGFENKWKTVTSANSATYTNLKPGNYSFMVQAVSGIEEKSDIASYSFSIDFPFWQTYWFYGLVTIGLMSLIYGYIQIRIEFLEKQRLQELVDEQTKDLQEALEEKEVLIKEIHHRVKNNLAVISGLLELQMGYAENKFVNRVLSESQRRVQSIAMIHEKLYQNQRLAEIDFEKYARELIDIIAHSFDYADKEIDVNIDIDNFKLGVDQGIPCGLILNELISNSFEHAFKNQEKGIIKVKAEQMQGSKVTIVVEDNGRGLPEDLEVQNKETLGLTIIETLCKQLRGDFILKNADKGTRFSLEFSREEAQFEVPA